MREFEQYSNGWLYIENGPSLDPLKSLQDFTEVGSVFKELRFTLFLQILYDPENPASIEMVKTYPRYTVAELNRPYELRLLDLAGLS